MSRLWKWFVPSGVLIFLLAAGLRLSYVVLKQTYLQQGMAAELEHAAFSLARDGEIANVYGPDSGPTAHIVPFYPLLLAGIYQVFGLVTPLARLVQEVLATLATATVIALLPWLARRTGLRPAAGWLAGGLLAILPINLWIETSGSWEQPYSALALVGLLAVFLALHDRRWQSPVLVVVAGLLIGAIALLGPAVLPAAICLGLAEWWVQRGARRRVAASLAAMALVALLCVSPWMYRNYRVLGGLVPTRSNFGLELCLGNNPLANGRTYGTSWEDSHSVFGLIHPGNNPHEQARIKQVGELAYMHDKQRQAVDWIAAHPGDFAALTLERFRLFWFPPADLWCPSTPAREIKSVCFTVIGLATLAGLLVLVLRRHRYAWLLAAAVLGPTLPYMITHVDTRYRYPVFALSTLLACDAVVRAALVLGRLWKPASRPSMTSRSAT